jgi:hypothetical protein
MSGLTGGWLLTVFYSGKENRPAQMSAQGDLKLSDHLLIFGVQADPKPQ